MLVELFLRIAEPGEVTSWGNRKYKFEQDG